MTDLQSWANVAEIAGGVIVIGGAVVAITQLAGLRRERRERAAIELVHSFQNDAFVRAVRIVWRLPAGARARDVAGDRDTEEAATHIGNALAGVGYLVYRRMVPLDVADETMGNVALVAWPRLERWVSAARRTTGTPDTYQWFEWFVGEVRKRRARGP